MYEENIALFIYELQYILFKEKAPFINEGFASHINAFTYLYYNEYQELFNLLYEPDVIKDLIKEEYQSLPENYIMYILTKYQGTDNYLKLIEEIEPVVASKINELVLKFLEYFEEVVLLYQANPYQYTRILQ